MEFSGGPLDLTAKLGHPAITESVATAANQMTSPAPVVVELDPTSFCDLSCPECISGSLLNQGRFTPQRLTDITEELIEAGVKAVILIGGGEPLLHPVTSKIITKLHDADVAIGLTTNGTQIMRNLEIIAHCLSWTRVSVDAASADCYQRFRPSRSGRNYFEHVIDGMRQLARHKEGALGFSFLLMSRRDSDGTVIDSNFDEVLLAGKLAKETKCDYFEVKPEYNMEHYLIHQDPHLIHQLIEQLTALESLQSDHFSVLLAENLKAVAYGLPLTQPKEYDRCLISELRTLITSRGAYICPYHRGNEEANYGDPTTVSFIDLWKGQARQDVMSRIRPSTHCRFHCIRDGSNRELLKIATSGELPTTASTDLFI